jgi:hypothetical protein
MSYSNRVMKDNPVGFWRLDGNSEDSSNGYWNAGTLTLNPATLTSVTSSGIPPLVTGHTSAVKITSSGNISITNNYKMFFRGTERESFSIDFWLSFRNIPNNTSVLTIGSSGNIKLTFKDNLATLTLIDSASNTYTALLEVDSYESQMHVAVVYERRNLKFYINGKSSTSIFIDSFYYFKDVYSSAPEFKFGPAGSSDSFIIDAIAFYKYALTEDQIRNRLIWGLTDSNPSLFTINNGGGILDPDDQSGSYEGYFLYNNDFTWKLGLMKNCIVSDGNLTSQYISPASLYNPLAIMTAPTFSTFSGLTALTTSGGESVRFEDFDKYYNPMTQTITAKAYFVTSSSEGTYFSIEGFSFGQLVVKKTSGSNTITVIAPNNSGGSVSAASQTISSSKWVDISIACSGNIMTVTVDGGTPFTLTMTSNITINKAILYAGNSYTVSSSGVISALPTGASYGVSYISVFDDETIPYDYTEYGNFTMSLQSTTEISQRSTWEILLPSTTTSNIIGSQATIGTSSKNVSLYSKPVGGVYKKQNVNGEKLPQLAYGSTGTPMYVKIVIDTPASSFARPKARFLEVALYTSLSVHSKGKSFAIDPYTTSVNHTYQVKDLVYNILARSSNFGFHFEGDTDGTSETPGMALITLPTGETFRTIEFWFRIDSVTSGTSYLLGVGSGNGVSISHDNAASPVLTISGFATNLAFINGVAATSATLNLGEPYHFMGVLSANSSSTVYLNAISTYGTTQSRATYGNVTLYDDAKTAPFALKKYNKFLGVSTSIISDTALATLYEVVTPVKAKWSTVKGAVV